MFSTKSIFCAALGASLNFAGTQAQAVADVPIDIDGAFEGATLSGTDFNSGGSIRCNSQTVTVPSNLQVTFPAAFVGFKDFVASSSAYTGYQCSIVGNVVNGQAIAAQISISQFSTVSASGYIDSLDISGAIKIKGGGATIRINDPRGVYSSGTKAHPFFTADDANPSVSSFSGFPMCVPRSKDVEDPLCPISNRPGGKQGTLQVPDPFVMAPLMPGDFIEYAGIEANGEILVYNLVASNIQLTTSTTDPQNPGPAYIRMEDANIGVWSADANQEIAQTRFVGYTSDGAASVKIYAIDYDPCTGVSNYREIAGATPVAGAPRNKFEYRLKATQNDQYTREYRIVATTGTNTTKNGIEAGTYVMPVSEWIQPEDSVPGLPPSPHDFRSYAWLTKGLGRDADGNLWGPLNPFPQSNPTLFDDSKCAAIPPPVASPPPSPVISSSSSSPPAPKPTADTVQMTSYSWVSSQSGTLTVSCSSSTKNNDAAVVMKLSYTNKDGTTTGLAMTAAGNGVFNFQSNKIKQPNAGSVVCKSGLGGSASR